MMKNEQTIFPQPILELPEANIPIDGLKAFLSQSENHQIIFMEFKKNAQLDAHSHDAQWGIVLDGKIEITINEKTTNYQKGDSYYIPKGVVHSCKIHEGYSDITFFAQKDRYSIKNS